MSGSEKDTVPNLELQWGVIMYAKWLCVLSDFLWEKWIFVFFFSASLSPEMYFFFKPWMSNTKGAHFVI